MIAFLEQQASFRKPVFKDDTLRPQFEVEGTEHRPGMEWGRLAIKVRLINQRDEIVLEGRHVYRIPVEPPRVKAKRAPQRPLICCLRGDYFAPAGNAGNLSMSRASCWMIKVALKFSTIFFSDRSRPASRRGRS